MARNSQDQQAEFGQQAGRDLINIVEGVDVAAVGVMLEATREQLRAEFALVARQTADERLDRFEERLTRRFESVDDLRALRDPDFQYNILEAQRSAVRTDSEDDWDILAELLADRAGRIEDQRSRLSTRRAIEAVGQVDGIDLATLAILYYMIRVIPLEGSIDLILKRIAEDVEPLLDHGLQTRENWPSYLELAGCIQVFQGFGMSARSLEALIAHKMPGYVTNGLSEEEAENARQALDRRLPGLAGVIQTHPLDSTRFFVAGAQVEDRLVDWAIEYRVPLSRSDIRDILGESYFSAQLPGHESHLRPRLLDHRAIKRLLEWWPAVPALRLTGPGEVLGFAHLSRMTARDMPRPTRFGN